MAQSEALHTSESSLDDPAPAMLAEVVRHMVSSPEQVNVTVLPDGTGFLVKLRVSQADLPLVNGTNNRTADCLRTLLSALGRKHGKQMKLQIEPI